jgi:hypothetical protein
VGERLSVTMKIGNNSLNVAGNPEDVWKLIEVFKLLSGMIL